MAWEGMTFEDVKRFLAWAKDQGATKVSVGDVSVEFSPEQKQKKVALMDPWELVDDEATKQKMMDEAKADALYHSS